MKTTQPNDPRLAISKSDFRYDVDLDKLDLDYQPTTPIPSWKPTASVPPYESLTKLYIDIETRGLDPETGRIYMVGLMDDNGVPTIITNENERSLLIETMEFLTVNQPQVLVGHNHVTFDLPFLAKRCRLNGIPHPFKRYDKISRITSASVNGKPIEFYPVYWSGTHIVDTYHQIAIWDKAASKLSSYGLKGSVLALKLREDKRLELDYKQIDKCWLDRNLEPMIKYLVYDLDDTKLLADFLLPIVYYQLNYVPNIPFQALSTSSAIKHQKIHESLLVRGYTSRNEDLPFPDERVSYEGGKVGLLKSGLFSDVAKIDVASLYPSIMLRYGLCSRKDPDNLFLGVLEYMRSERMKLKKLAKGGDRSASFQEQALKVLINSSYGFLGTGGYSFNDYESACLIPAYGRKILDLMVDTIVNFGGEILEIDTDGVFFTSPIADQVAEAVADALPEGIEIELEFQNCHIFLPVAKNYILVDERGKVTVKGAKFRGRNNYPLQNEFQIEFIRLYFVVGEDAAEKYYLKVRHDIRHTRFPLEKLTITRKIGKAEVNLVDRKIGNRGDVVSYWYADKNGAPIETKTNIDYSITYYIDMLDKLKQSIVANPLLFALPLFDRLNG